MFRKRLVVLGVSVVLSVAAVVASSASAAVTFQWKVGGSLLPSGSNRTLTASAESNFDLAATAGGAAALLLSSKLKVAPGAKVFGGQPGTSEEVIEFESVTVDRPAKCGISQSGVAGIIKFTSAKLEVVEGASAEKGNGESELLLAPTTGTVFSTFELTGAECTLKGQIPAISGSGLALPLPNSPTTELLTQLLDIEAVTKEYKNFKKEFKKAGLVFAGNSAAATGAILTTLTSDEKFGAF